MHMHNVIQYTILMLITIWKFASWMRMKWGIYMMTAQGGHLDQHVTTVNEWDHIVSQFDDCFRSQNWMTWQINITEWTYLMFPLSKHLDPHFPSLDAGTGAEFTTGVVSVARCSAAIAVKRSRAVSRTRLIGRCLGDWPIAESGTNPWRK